MMTTLYKVSANGNKQFWSILQVPKNKSLKIQWGVIHGVTQEQVVQIETNQSGRSIEEQCKLEADARVNKQLDKGYCHSIDEAIKSIGLNASKMPKPMLALKYQDVNVDHTKCMYQYKYNGHRCIIASTQEGIISYSRNGKTIPGIDHILNDIEFKLPVGTYLDGELYIHGKPLQEIGSLIRKQQVGSEKLRFICYDQMSIKTFDKRFDGLYKLNLGAHIDIAPTVYGSSMPDLNDAILQSIAYGYEGGMLRMVDRGYENKRSKQLIKVKIPDDREVAVVNVHESADGWAILECITLDSAKVFRVSAPGTIEEKTHALHNKHLWVGQLLTIEHFGLTNDGIPFHPVAIGLRDAI